MLQKVSLFLICSLLVLSSKPLHALTCEGIFQSEVSRFSNLDIPQSYTIENERIGVSIEITRRPFVFAAMEIEALTLLNLLKAPQKVIAKYKDLLQEFSGIRINESLLNTWSVKLSQEIATRIFELETLLRDEQSNGSRVHSLINNRKADALKLTIENEIKSTNEKLLETEDLVYKLHLISDKLSGLQNGSTVLHKSLFDAATSQVQILKRHLENMNLLKSDLLNVIENKPITSDETQYLYIPANLKVSGESNIIRVTRAAPVEAPRAPYIEHESRQSLRTIPVPHGANPARPDQIRAGTLGITVQEAPNYRGSRETSVGSSSLRPIEYTNPVNAGRGVVATTYVPQAASTSQVQFNRNSRKMSLKINYTPASKIFPAQNILLELRAWAKENGLHSEMTFSHSGKLNDPILVTVSEKVSKESLRKFRKYFRSYEPELRQVRE